MQIQTLRVDFDCCPTSAAPIQNSEKLMQKITNSSPTRCFSLLLCILFAALAIVAVDSLATAQATNASQPEATSAAGQIYLPAILKNASGSGGAPVMPSATPSVTPTATETESAPESPTPSATPSATGTQTATSTTTATPERPEPNMTDEPVSEIAASIGLTITNALQTDALAGRLLAAEAVFAASQLANTGQVVTNGTLTVDSNNGVTYDPNPADRLHAILADGRTFDFYISQMAGDFSSNATNYLDNAHQFSVRTVAGPDAGSAFIKAAAVDMADVQIISNQGNGQLSIRVTGEMENGGQAYTVDLTALGTYFFESSLGGLEQRQDYTLTGTVTGAQLALTANEGYRNERVVADGTSVSTADTENNSSWSSGGATFASDGGLIRRSFRDGVPSQLDSYWQATGNLLQNGQVVGTFGLDTGNAMYVRVLLRLDNREIELQRFQRFSRSH